MDIYLYFLGYVPDKEETEEVQEAQEAQEMQQEEPAAATEEGQSLRDMK